MSFEYAIREAFNEFVKANGGFDHMESNLKSYIEEAIQEGDNLSYVAECFCNDLDSFDGYLIEAINNLISSAKIDVTIEF